MKTIKTLLWILILSTPLLITSQAKAFGGNHPRSTDSKSNKAPIDGGITLLAAAGIGLGIKKMRSRRESNKENDSNI